MGWPLLIVIAVVASFVLFVLGAFMLIALGVQQASKLAYAPLASFAFLAAASIVSAWIPWQPHVVAIEYLVILLILCFIRKMLTLKGKSISFWHQLQALRAGLRPWGKPAGLLTSGAFLLNAVLVCVFISISVASPENFILIYDNTFHYSVIRNITEVLNASPFGAGCVAGTASATYPALFHACTALIAQAFNIPIQAALWAFLLVNLMVSAPLGFMLLARTLVPANVKNGAGIVALLSPALLGKVGALVYVTFGSLLSNFLGLVLLPMAVALTLATMPRCCVKHLRHSLVSEKASQIANRSALGVSRGKHAAISDQANMSEKALDVPAKSNISWGVFAAVLLVCVFTLGLSHPGTVFLYGIIIIVALVAQPMPVWKKVVILLLACTVWTVLFYNPFFARTVQWVPTTEVAIGLWAVVERVFSIDYATAASIEMLPFIMFVVIVGLSCVIAWLLRRHWSQSWYLVVLGIFAALWLCTLFPTNWFTQFVAGFWYRDNVRLREVFLYSAAILVACIPSMLFALAGRVTTATARKGLRGGICVVTVSILGIMSYLSLMYDVRVLGDITSLPVTSDDQAAVTQASDPFLQNVSEIAQGATVLNNTEDASVWLYAKYGTDSVRKARVASQISALSADEVVVLSRIADYANDDEVSAAVKRLNIGYVVQMDQTPRLVTTDTPSGDFVWVSSGEQSVVTENTPGFELVLQDGSMKLFKVK